jgi:predicted RNase H-like nuclease (RuvC/YqgF family)
MAQPSALVYKTHDNNRAVAAAAPASETGAIDPWQRWVEELCESRIQALCKSVGEVLAEFRHQARERCTQLQQELELLRREFHVLQGEVAAERGLRDLRAEVTTAREQIPQFPAIAARLEAEQKRLQRELDATQKKLLKVRANQSTTDYSLSELHRKFAAAKATPTMEMELSTSVSTFRVSDLDPAAATALKKFASECIDGYTGDPILLFDSAGTA